jgi:undecaprenyl-diphosphatase
VTGRVGSFESLRRAIRRGRGIFLAWAAAFAALSALAGAGQLERLDTGLLRLAQSHSSALLDAAGSALSVPGRAGVSAAALAALAGGLYLRGRGRLGWRLLVSLLATTVVEILLKFVLPQAPVPQEVGRVPDPSPIDFDTPHPYPSGHMLRAVLILGAFYLLWPNPLVRLGAALLLAGSALARVYLGTHWPSDVLGGALLGAAGLAWAFGAEGGNADHPRTGKIRKGRGTWRLPW